MKKLKILHLYKQFFPDSQGGLERVIREIARGTSQLNADVSILSLSRNPEPKELEMEGYTVYRARMDCEIASSGMSWEAISMFRALARRADIVHYHFPWPFADLLHLLANHGKPSVLTYHSDIIRQNLLRIVYRPLKRCFLRSVDHIVATSPNYLKSSDILTQYIDKVSVIPIGIDYQYYSEANPEKIKNWRMHLPERFFLFIGVLRYYKGLHILVEAAAGTSYPVVIVGAGPVENDIRKHARQCGLKNIHFLGELAEEDKIALLRLCYGVVFPSHMRSEAFGVTLLEGALSGKPLISSEIGTGTSYININGQTGLVVPPGNPVQFRKAMQYLWDNPEVAEAMGQAAKKRYHELFTADRMVQSYCELYERLLSR